MTVSGKSGSAELKSSGISLNLFKILVINCVDAVSALNSGLISLLTPVFLLFFLSFLVASSLDASICDAVCVVMTVVSFSMVFEMSETLFPCDTSSSILLSTVFKAASDSVELNFVPFGASPVFSGTSICGLKNLSHSSVTN